MVNYCAVADCSSCSRNPSDVRFFRFPKDEHVCALWIKACGKQNVNEKYERICSLHFTEDDWCLMHKLMDIPRSKKKLDPKAIPSRNLPTNCINNPISRKHIVGKRNPKKSVINSIESFEQRFLQEHNTSQYLEEDIPYDNIEFSSVQTQTNFNTECSKERRIRDLEKQLQACQKENEQIRIECRELRSLETSIKSIFTDRQIKRLKNPKLKLNWTSDEMTSATYLHSLSPRTYQFLYKNNFPLPGPSTLKLRTFKTKPDIL